MFGSKYVLVLAGVALPFLFFVSGCGDDTGVCENVQCPGGYSCVEMNGKGACVGPDAGKDMGKVKDIGPRLDKKKPTPDRGKKLDGGTGKDQKAPPKDLPGKKDGPAKPLDKGLQPDMSSGGPVNVNLIAPANNASSPLVEVGFAFKVNAANKVASCELWMNSTLQGTLTSPAASATFKKKGLKDGKYTWSVKCKDNKGQAGGSGIWTLTIAPKSLTKCKTSGFMANTRYKVSQALTSTGGDCFVVDASGVHLDGSGMAVSVPRYKDLLIHRGSILYPSVYKNPGTTGSWVKTWTTPYKNTAGNTPTAADFNGDGRLDLVLPATTTNLRVFRASANGSFHAAPYYTSKQVRLMSPRAVDLNQDGAPDLIAGGNSSGEELALNKGLAGLMYQTAYNWGIYTSNLDVGDFTGDRVMDLVVGGGLSFLTHKRQLQRGIKASSSFGFITQWSLSSNEMRGGGEAIMADFDSDGDMDLALPNSWNNGVSTRTYYNNGTGSFSSGKSFSSSWPIAARDMNGDGKPDLVVRKGSVSQPTEIVVHLNDGKGNFKSSKNIAAGGTITSSMVRDVNGDGLPDLLLGVLGKSSYIRVFKNQFKTTGSFLLAFSYFSRGTPRILDARDMNNDGLLDLVSHVTNASNTLSSVMLHRQNASGSYTTSAVVVSKASSTPYFAAALGDLTGAQARAVHIKSGAKNVTVSNVGPIRGFSTGVLVEGDAATVEGVEVVDPDLYGVRFDGVNTGKVDGLKMSQLFQGTALSLDNAKIVTVSNSNLCDGGQDPRLTPMGASCVMSAANGSNNRLNRNNGCTTLAFKPCQ